jgi:polar amino acid transport system substrate-binding protein
MKTVKILLAFVVAAGLIIGASSCQKKQEEPQQAAQDQAAEEQAAPMKTIIVATDATWPPMEMVDKDKNIVGFDIDFLNAVAQEAGFKVEFKNTAWDGIFGGLDLGKYDAVISSVTITDERKQTYDFSLPYINAGQVLTVPISLEGIVSLADMKGKQVGAQIGTTGAMESKKVEGVVAKNYDEIGLAFEDMASGRIQGVVCDTPVAADYALQRDEYREKFKIVGAPFTEESYGIVVKKGNQELLDLLNKGIQAVQAKGIDKDLEDKWLR